MEQQKILEEIAASLRADALEMVYDVKDGHLGPAYSAVDIITALYFGGILRVNPQDPNDRDRDRFVLSKGHACPVLYAALARKGFFPREELLSLRKIHSRLQGHPVLQKTPGIDAVTGSLGNGLAMAVGMALGLKYRGSQARVYVLVGDGEFQEGVIWESLMGAVHHRLDNLTVLMDHNLFQSGGSIEEVSGLLPVLPKMQAFNLECREVDGHDYQAILDAVRAGAGNGRPSFILCHTTKGKGVPFMEGDNSWHKRVPTEEQYVSAKSHLKGEA